MDRAAPSDADLVHRARAGDRDAFDLLARRHVARLVGVARRILRDADAAEDAAAEACLRALQGLSRLRSGASFGAWIHGIACRAALDRLRARRREAARGVAEGALSRRREPAESRASTEPAPLERVAGEESVRALRAAVDDLPEAQRLVVVLRAWEGLAYEEVARLLGSSYDAVRVNMAHARRRLRAVLAGRVAREAYEREARR